MLPIDTRFYFTATMAQKQQKQQQSQRRRTQNKLTTTNKRKEIRGVGRMRWMRLKGKGKMRFFLLSLLVVFTISHHPSMSFFFVIKMLDFW